MRLINVHTLQLEQFDNSSVPPYAIVSHTHGKEEEEVSFQDFSSGKSRFKENAGFEKILRACSIAKGDELGYVWIDTACIDKTVWTEHNEAINSMFEWYEKSAVCCAYLDGVDWEGSGSSSVVTGRWFTRGWTLPEWIAPRMLYFFDRSWKLIGPKDYGSHADDIYYLINSSTWARGIRHARQAYSIGRRMSWVQHRKTDRVEDLAYCMLGIFNVKMDIRYGEGANAFIRLQEEIAKQTSDHSLLIWDRPESPTGDLTMPIMAPEPSHFASASVIAMIQSPGKPGDEARQPLLRSDGRLVLQSPLIETLDDRLVFAVLWESHDWFNSPDQTWMSLWKNSKGSYYRVDFPGGILRPRFDFGLPQHINMTPVEIFLETPRRLLLGSPSSETHGDEHDRCAEEPRITLTPRSAGIGVVMAFPTGKRQHKMVGSFPQMDSNDMLGVLWLSEERNSYRHGIIAFEASDDTGSFSAGVFFATAVSISGDVFDGTCRVVQKIEDTSPQALQSISKSQLKQLIRQDDISDQFDNWRRSPFWRSRAQNKKIFVEMLDCMMVVSGKQILTASIILDCPKIAKGVPDKAMGTTSPKRYSTTGGSERGKYHKGIGPIPWPTASLVN